MVGSDHIVQDCLTIESYRFIEPLKPPLPFLCKLQQKFSLMTTVGEMPYLPWNIISFRSGHGFPFIILVLTAKTTI